MTKNQKAITKKYEEQKQKFLNTHILSLGEHLIYGHEFLENFKTQSTYYTAWGFDFAQNKYRYKLLALIPVNDPVNTYHRTCTDDNGQMYVAAFLMNERNVNCDMFYNIDSYKEWAKNHPVTVYFLGCDDGSYSKRFKCEDDAIAYLNKHKTLDDIVEDNIGMLFYEDMIKRKIHLNTMDSFNIYDSLLNIEN